MQPGQALPICGVEGGTPTGETSEHTQTRDEPGREATSEEGEDEIGIRTSCVRAFFGNDDDLKGRPASCPTLPRETINTYTDGGVKNPANKWLATAGFGIWTPNVGTNEITIDARGVDQDETPVGGDGPLDTTLFTFSAKEGGGLKQWASLPGQRCSSTRVEQRLRSSPCYVVTPSTWVPTVRR